MASYGRGGGAGPAGLAIDPARGNIARVTGETTTVLRSDGRAAQALRPLEMLPGWTSSAAGSVLMKQGRTWVLATVSVEPRVPRWRVRTGKGWLTASYNLLPGATSVWTPRDRAGANGRTHEIERLIGRSLRAAIDVDRLPELTLHVDCDVLQADGGTRTTAVTAGWLALALALGPLGDAGRVPADLLARQVAAVSVGIVDGQPMLDLSYDEDARAQTDMNAVMTGDGGFVELQGTAERRVPFTRSELDDLVALAGLGARALMATQMEVLNGVQPSAGRAPLS